MPGVLYTSIILQGTSAVGIHTPTLKMERLKLKERKYLLGSHVTVEPGISDQFHRPLEPSAVAAVGGAVLRCGEKVPSSCLLPRAPSCSTGQARSCTSPLPRGQREGWRAREAEEASWLISTLCLPTVSLGAQVTFPPDPRVQALPCREVWGMEAAGIGLEPAEACPGLQGRSRAGGLPR